MHKIPLSSAYRAADDEYGDADKAEEGEEGVDGVGGDVLEEGEGQEQERTPHQDVSVER